MHIVLKPKTVLKWNRKSTERSVHRPHAHISTFFFFLAGAVSPPTVCKTCPWFIALLYDVLHRRQTWANSLWGRTSVLGKEDFPHYDFACKFWIWHLHLSVISSGYQFQISSLCWQLCCIVLTWVYVYLEHLASLHCAIVSQNAWFGSGEIFPLWFSMYYVMAFAKSKLFFQVILCTSSA